MRVFRLERKFWLALLIAAITSSTIFGLAKAQVGSVQDCFSSGGSSTFDFITNGINNLYIAQTFTADESYQLLGVKLDMYSTANTGNNIFTIELRDTDGTPPNAAPDTVLISATLVGADLPSQSVGIPFSCASTSAPTKMVEFASPVNIIAGNQYAIVVRNSGGSGGNSIMAIGLIPSAGGYTGGFEWGCNIPTSCSDTPATWDAASSWDIPFATYNNVITTTEADIDSWLPNFLASMGLNSTFGKLLAGTIFTGIIVIFAITFKVPWILALGLGGLTVTFLTAALIFNPAVLLALSALIMLGGIGMIFAILMGGNRDG